MRSYNPDAPLISMHIPKCGGTSFRGVLKSWFGRRLYWHYHDERRDRPPKRHDFGRGLFRRKAPARICIHGHFNHRRGEGAGQYYPEVDQFISFLRDPFEIHLSNYFYAKSQGEAAFRGGELSHIVAQGYDLERYLEKKKRSYLLAFLPPEISADNFREILEQRFVYLGVLDDYQASIDHLAERLGFASVRVDLENPAPRLEPLPEHARERFVENNPLEMAIYRYALEGYLN